MIISGAERAIRIRKLKSEQRWVIIAGTVKLMMIFVVIGIFFIMNYGVCVISGNDMFPAVRDGDIAVYYKHPDYINGDAVIIRNGDKYMASRIQAVEGSVVSITGDGHLTIDGNIQPKQERSGIYSETMVSKYDDIEYPYQIGSGSVILLGDNRETAKDSRQIGSVRKSALLGKTFMIIRRRAI